MAKRVAVILHVDGRTEVLQDFEHTDHKRMGEICGGYCDFFRPYPEAVDALERELGLTGKLRTGAWGFQMRVAVNDEGHQRELAFNERATKLYQGPHYPSKTLPCIVGDALLVEVD